LVQELSQLVEQIERLVLNEEKWVSTAGRDEFSRRKTFLMQREKDVELNIDNLSAELDKLRKDISKKIEM
jgi:hypothetical protein